MHNLNKNLINRLIIYFLISLAISLGPIMLVHEGAHAAVCMYNGLEPKSAIDLWSASITCESISKDILLFYWAVGGVVAGIVCLTPLVLHSVRSHIWITAVLIAVFVAQISNSILETFAHTWYIQRWEDTIILVGIQFMVLYSVIWLKIRSK